jgi:GcrA cell cycle regulator
MWTDERVELLQKLWGQGFSASQIANQLQGVTRNAVIGKIHRLGKRGPGAPKTARARTGGFGAPAARHRASRPASAPDARRLQGAPPEWAFRPHHRVMDAEEPGLATCTTLAAHMCRWPIGDPDTSDFTFCGRPSDGSRPYCQGHAGMAYKRGSGSDADVGRLYARYL